MREVAEHHGGEAFGAAELGQFFGVEQGAREVGADIEAEGGAQAFAIGELAGHGVDALAEQAELVAPQRAGAGLVATAGDGLGGLEHAGDGPAHEATQQDGNRDDGDGGEAKQREAEKQDLTARLGDAHGQNIDADDADELALAGVQRGVGGLGGAELVGIDAVLDRDLVELKGAQHVGVVGGVVELPGLGDPRNLGGVEQEAQPGGLVGGQEDVDRVDVRLALHDGGQFFAPTFAPGGAVVGPASETGDGVGVHGMGKGEGEGAEALAKRGHAGLDDEAVGEAGGDGDDEQGRAAEDGGEADIETPPPRQRVERGRGDGGGGRPRVGGGRNGRARRGACGGGRCDGGPGGDQGRGSGGGFDEKRQHPNAEEQAAAGGQLAGM